MARVFISGSTDGLGLKAGELLLGLGHNVTFHARSELRAEDLRQKLSKPSDIVVGDVDTIAAMRSIADQVNKLGLHDAAIHNVAVGYREPSRRETKDGLSQLFAVNVLAPYVLTAAIPSPQRVIYLSSDLHRKGKPDLSDLQWSRKPWNGVQAYSDSKLLDTLIAFGIARRWPKVFSNAVEPGWVATKMGGPGAPDDLKKGAETQVWLAVSDDPAAKVSGVYFFYQEPNKASTDARRTELQDTLLDYCYRLSGLPV